MRIPQRHLSQTTLRHESIHPGSAGTCTGFGISGLGARAGVGAAIAATGAFAFAVADVVAVAGLLLPLEFGRGVRGVVVDDEDAVVAIGVPVPAAVVVVEG